jgi:sulfur carrier protein
MRIQVNGCWHEVPSAALAGALADLGYAQAVVTTAVNGEFVATEARLRTLLAEGDRLEVLAPMQGG